MQGQRPLLILRWFSAVLAFLALLPLTGCGTALYLSKIGGAKERLEEARELGAEEKTPYEYYAAKARLEEAKKEASRAEYGDAIRLAKESRNYSRQAVHMILEGSAAGETGNTSPAAPAPQPSGAQSAPAAQPGTAPQTRPGTAPEVVPPPSSDGQPPSDGSATEQGASPTEEGR